MLFVVLGVARAICGSKFKNSTKYHWGLGDGGAGRAETIFSDVYKVRMATTRAVWTNEKPPAMAGPGAWIWQTFFFPLSKYKRKTENFPVVLGRAI